MAQNIKTNPKDEAKTKMESKPVVETKTTETVAKKSRKIWILLGIALFALAACGAGLIAYPRIRGLRNSNAEKATQEFKSARVKGVLPLESFLVNLADHANVCFVKATFTLGLEEKWEEDNKNSVAIASMRDSIISLLTSKTTDQIMTPQGKDILREEIRSRANAISPKIKVVEVYIVDFVIQP
jgi:flagellar protein FliL